MKMLFAVVTLLTFFSLKVDGQQADKVSLGVYYETLCPDSIAFITYQLYPTIQSLGLEKINVDLVPFGKASWTESGSSISFSCQHGERECKGNKIQACAKSELDTSALIKFVNCMESASSPDRAGKSCAQKQGLNYTTIENCANGAKGSQLLKEQGVATKSLVPKPNFIPWITVNNQHTSDIQNRALDDLKGLLCDSFPQGATKPSGCK